MLRIKQDPTEMFVPLPRCNHCLSSLITVLKLYFAPVGAERRTRPSSSMPATLLKTGIPKDSAASGAPCASLQWCWWGHAVSTLLRLLRVRKYQGMVFVGKAEWFSYGLNTNSQQSALLPGGSASGQPTATGILRFMEPLHPAPLALPEAAGLSLHSVPPVALSTPQP